MVLDVDTKYSFYRRLSVSDARIRTDLDDPDLTPCKLKEPDRLRRVAAFAGADSGPKKKSRRMR